ncbi:BglG family transcription antiterminator [Tepidanaerobacter sp. EBM-38]|uniref:BglG family transcription antiterminator n=1 Tax=Tepidanaerobacter sp. EBM-38 TaxID=1918496 RepID=UPI000B1C9713|nr:BglG family transcription antiterminator [Tepidanaerobacter sp. EBM-38]
MDFSSREIKILNILLEGPSTSKKIAKSMNISPRTVLRELPIISKKLKDYNIILKTKTGSGIFLIGKESDIDRLKQYISSTSPTRKLSPKERQQLIILSLLQEKEPQKLLNFANEYQVTEATISYDLDACEQIFEKYNLELMRRPGLGVWIEGTEKGIRQLVTDLFYKNFDENQLINILKDKLPAQKGKSNSDSLILSDEIKGRLLKLVDADLIKQIERALEAILGELEFPLADSAYIGLIVHVALAIERLKSGEQIQLEGDILSALKESDEFNIAKQLSTILESDTGIAIPEEEMGYITMYLLGAKFRNLPAANDFFVLDNFEVADISREILAYVSDKLGEDLTSDMIAIEGLILHLKPAISRLRLGMDIRNPLLKQLEEKYKDLMKIADESASILEKKYGFTVPRSEVGYIAMHIGAALERKRYNKVPVILACASGIGSARMLASRLHKELPQINIIDIVSFLDLNKAIKKYPYVDTIITTIPFESDEFNVIQVSPFLDETEAEILRSHIKMSEKGFPPTIIMPSDNKGSQSQDYKNEVILSLIQDFVLRENISVKDKQDLFNQFKRWLREDVTDASVDEAIKDLKTREASIGCAIPGKSISILHARTKGVKKPFFGVYRLKKPILMRDMDGESENVTTVLVMLLPVDPSLEALDLMGRISIALIEDTHWTETIKTGSGTDVIQGLVKITR